MVRILGHSQSLLLILCLVVVPALPGCKKTIIKSNVKDFGAEVDGGDEEEICLPDPCPDADDVELGENDFDPGINPDAVVAQADGSAANQNMQEPDGVQLPVDVQTDDPGRDGPLELTGSASNSTRKIAKANVTATEMVKILEQIIAKEGYKNFLIYWQGQFGEMSKLVNQHTYNVKGMTQTNAAALNAAHVVLETKWRKLVASAQKQFKNIVNSVQGPVKNDSVYWNKVNNYIAKGANDFNNDKNAAVESYKIALAQLKNDRPNLQVMLAQAKADALATRRNSASSSSSSSSSSSASTPTVKPTVKPMYSCNYPAAQFVGFYDSSVSEDGRPEIRSNGGDSDLTMGLVCRCKRPSHRIVGDGCQRTPSCGGSPLEVWRLGSLVVPAGIRANMPYGDDYPIRMKKLQEGTCRDACAVQTPSKTLTFACDK